MTPPHAIDADRFIAGHVELVPSGPLQTQVEPETAARPIKSSASLEPAP
jgi:hypothetical protein